MDISSYWPTIRDYWQGQWRELRNDFLKLDSASRPFAVAAVMAGALRGLVPIATLITLYRLTDAAIGARAVGVATSDLTRALWSFGAVSLVGLALVLGSERLRGLMGKVANKAAGIACAASLAVCVFILGPMRLILVVILMLALQAVNLPRRADIGALLVVLALHVSLFLTSVTFLVTRVLTVGGFFMFAGAVVASASWLVINRVRVSQAT